MTAHAVGVDIIEIERVRKALKRHPRRFRERVYTKLEAALCRDRAQDLAARFAGKEAVMKALGTGARGVGWTEIEILPNRRGKPIVHLHGRAKARAAEIGLREMDVSLTHSHEFAVAAVVAVRDEVDEPAEAREWLESYMERRGWL